MRSLLPALGLLCAGLAYAAPPAAPPPEPAPAEAPAPLPAALESARAAADAGRFAEALTQASPLISTSQPAPTRAVALAVCAQALAGLNRSSAAEAAYALAFEADALAAAPWVSQAVTLAEQTKDSSRLGRALAPHPGLAVSDEARDTMALLIARQLVRDADPGLALAALARVDAKGPNWGEAEGLRGVVLAQRQAFTDATTPFVTAHSLAVQAGDTRSADHLALNAARAYYGAGNWGQAITWYAKVGRSSPWWPEAQYERSWAHFRVGDINGTLALLQTHESPHFDGWYFPEAALLRAYSLFMLCKFPDASKTMDHFVEVYEPMRVSLDAATASPDYTGAYADLGKWAAGEATGLPGAVIRPLALSDRFKEAQVALAGLDADLAAMSDVPSPVRDAVQTHRDALLRSEGEHVIARAKAARDEISGLLSNIELSRIDLIQLEAQLLQQAVGKGEVERVPDRKALKAARKVRAGFRLWPYEGEYWADELGWYRVDTPSSCPASLGTAG